MPSAPLLPVATAAASPAMLAPLPQHSLLLPVADPFAAAAGASPMYPLPSSFDDDDMLAPFIPIPLTVMEAMMHQPRSGTTAADTTVLPPLLDMDAERLCRAPLITNRPRAVQYRASAAPTAANLVPNTRRRPAKITEARAVSQS
ncbi:hypothetical protein GGF31_001240 [Allomyces arbusculus]|nr:hypothetical protein GGF31_001240 [Allomyces arbusculus]